MTNGDSNKDKRKPDPDATIDPERTLGPDASLHNDPEQTIDPARAIGAERTIGPSSRDRSSQDSDETIFGSSIGPENRPAVADRNIQIEGYEILDELGRGGMGVVYKARDKGLNRTVALKMILAGVHASDDSLARFKIEAEAVAQLQHRGIVQVYDVGQADGQPYCALEYVDGGGLDELMSMERLSIGESVAIVEELSHAMSSAHQAGIVHRDLKPANVLIAKGGQSGSTINASTLGQYRPKITDFGLAKKVEQESQQTRTGTIMGTPGYMAPEQARGAKRVGPAADIYSLGAILYHLVVGRPPFVGENPLKTIMMVLKDPPTSPRAANSQIDRDLDTIILKCLEKEPAARYASAEHLAQDLHRYQMGMPIEARPVSGLERVSKWVRRKPWAAAMVALSVLGLIALFVGGAIFNRQLATAYQRVDEEHGVAKAALSETSRALEAESEARAKTDAALKSESEARNKTDQALAATDLARFQAEKSGYESRRRLIDNYVNNGLQALNEKLALQSLPWLSEAIALENDKDRLRIHQWRFNIALQQAPKPEQTWIRDASVEGCMLSSDGKRILCYSADRMIEIRDIASNTVIHELQSPSQIIGVSSNDDFSNVILVSVFVDAANGNFSASHFNYQLWQPESNSLTKPFQSAFEGRPKFAPTVNADRGLAIFRNDELSQLQVISLADQSVAQSYDVAEPQEERVRFDDTGRYLAWINDGKFQVADLDNENKIVVEKKLEQETDEQFCDFRMASDGRVILFDNRIRLIDFVNDSTIEFARHADGIPLAAVGPGDSGVALAWNDGLLELFTGDGQAIDRRLVDSKAKQIFYSDDGKHLFLASIFDVMKLAADSGDQLGSPIPSTLKPLNDATLSRDGQYLATASGAGIYNGNGCLRIWKVRDSSFKIPLRNSEKVTRWTASKDGKYVALLLLDKTLQIVDIRNRKRQTVLHTISPTAEATVRKTVWSGTGKHFAVQFSNGLVRCYNTGSFKPLGEFQLDNPSKIVFSSNNDLVAVSYGDDAKYVAVARTSNGEIVQEKLKHRRTVLNMRFTQNDQMLATVSEDINFRLFSVESGQREEKSNLRLLPLAAQFNRQGSIFAVVGERLGNKPGRLTFMETEEGEIVGESLDFDSQIEKVCFGNSGDRVAIADRTGIVRLIDVETKQDLGMQLVHPDPLSELQFSHDGRVLLTVCNDNKIRLFDVQSGVALTAPVGNDSGPASAIRQAQFLGKSLDILERTDTAVIWQNRIRNYDSKHAATLSRFLSGSVISERGTIIPSPPESLKEDFSDVTIRQVMEPSFIKMLPR